VGVGAGGGSGEGAGSGGDALGGSAGGAGGWSGGGWSGGGWSGGGWSGVSCRVVADNAGARAEASTAGASRNTGAPSTSRIPDRGMLFARSAPDARSRDVFMSRWMPRCLVLPRRSARINDAATGPEDWDETAPGCGVPWQACQTTPRDTRSSLPARRQGSSRTREERPTDCAVMIQDREARLLVRYGMQERSIRASAGRVEQSTVAHRPRVAQPAPVTKPAHRTTARR